MASSPDATRSSFDGLDLNDIVVFARVVQHGSFTTAAKLFGKSPSYMSKHVTQLENALKLTLLNRSTHNVFLTDAGSVFFDHCVRILSEIEAAKADASGLGSELIGTLRVHSTPGVGQALVAPAIIDFNALYPTVKVELTVSASSVNLMERGVDVVIGSRDFDDDDSFHTGLFERKLGPAPYVICAAPSYLEKHPRPVKPDDLRHHNCLIHTTQKPNPRHWSARVDVEEVVVEVDGAFHSNFESAIVLAAVQGAGIARLPFYSVAREIRTGELVSIFDGEIVSRRVIKAFYPKSRFVPKKLRAFLAMLEARLKETVSS
ncbi:LysR family transcriptional regulator [Ensifer adhaerens]|uniref:LysR family transcriptional regulator n=1 Tax=Ensifer adhaerens TaxID=106592 RepID=UPI001CBC86F3|nr:LysR family transcriptional regulator [Ensifer adhaerens]MBZ7926346.1 LysR family transcriptional regulator [Ensifer adhaerens]UAX97295.1 LysR family transcriptional regulator [Ensifer adhaerens]UAY03586.1 LysR family transcriptional regulator [Ensifer adhaerens]UAY11570.1 LysR family transcriptional regulator [Ensifer adhaerens]